MPAVAPAVTVPPADIVAEPTLLHTPPEVTSFNTEVVPAHADNDPLIVAGATFTVTALYALHPRGDVYVIVVVPTPAPVTCPVPETVAMAVLLLLHVPPVVASVRFVLRRLHIEAVPVIVPGNGLTVTGTTV